VYLREINVEKTYIFFNPQSELTQVSRVELLEDVLVVEVLEDGDGLVQLVVDLALGDALLRFLQQCIAVTSKLETG
jgi:hypothetical protein